jgi:hypothetical protein
MEAFASMVDDVFMLAILPATTQASAARRARLRCQKLARRAARRDALNDEEPTAEPTRTSTSRPALAGESAQQPVVVTAVVPVVLV